MLRCTVEHAEEHRGRAFCHPPLEQDAWGGLLGMHGRMMRWIDTDLQEHARITHVEFEALLRLSWAEGQRLRIQDLAAQSVIIRSGMGRMVERLERAGLVTREEASEDRRGPMPC